MKIQATYKCSLCDTKFTVGNPVDVKDDEIPDLLGKFVRNQQFQNNPILYNTPMYLPHKCKKVSGGGLAQFVGFLEV